MGHTNKTTKFQLPQFIKTDKPQMTDFNDAFKNIDDKVVSKAGDTMTGGLLFLANGLGRVFSDSTVLRLDAYKTEKDNDNYNSLLLQSDNSGNVLAQILRLVDVTNGVTKTYNIHGEHNKPTGSYTGNGSETTRTITTNGMGRSAIIYSNNGVAIVFGYGTIVASTNGIEYISGSKAFVGTSGNISLSTTDNRLNANGVTYYYYMP